MNTPRLITHRLRSARWAMPLLALASLCLSGSSSAQAQPSAGDTTVGVAIDIPQVDDPTLAPNAGDQPDSPTVESQSEEQSEDIKSILDRRGSITLKESSLSDWLFAIKQEWGVNFVYSNKELRTETMVGAFEDRPLHEILDVILSARGYGYQKVGNSLMIRKSDEIDLTSQFEDTLIRLEYLDPKEIVSSVEILLSAGGQVQAIPPASSIYVRDLPRTLTRVRSHVNLLEDAARLNAEREQQRLEEAEQQARVQADEQALTNPESAVEIDDEVVGVFRLRFVEASAMLDALGVILGAEGRINVMTEENKIVVMAPESIMQGVEEIVRRLDVPRPQVRITALLYDVGVEEVERLGFNWSNISRARINAAGDPQSLFELNSTHFADGAAAPAGGGGDGDGGGGAVVTNPFGGVVRLQHLSRYFDLNTVLQAFSQLEGARLLARPNVVAYDGVEALFRSVSEIPVQQLTQTSEGGAIGTTEFREAGITLTVTPRINDDGSLRLSVAPEFSVLAGFQDGQPIIDRRSAQTTVHLYDGQTVVIGGLLRRNELETQNGVPGLNRLKYLKPFFKFHDTTVAESELLVFIRAEVIGPEPVMAPRDEMAQIVLNDKLEQIPVAVHHPIIPHCGDPYCPYHCPAPLWFDGMAYDASSFGVPEKLPPTEFQQEIPPPVPTPDAAMMEPTPNWELGGRQPRPGTPTMGRQLPGIGAEPPPVMIDSAARMPRPQRKIYAIRRLPHIAHETDPENLAPVAAPYLPDRQLHPSQLRPLTTELRMEPPREPAREQPRRPIRESRRTHGGLLQSFIR